MLSMGKVFIAFVLLLGAAFGQSLSEGSVVGLQVLPNPVNNDLTYDFELCCGYPAGNGGFLGNGFSYARDEFSLLYKYPGTSTAYTVSASVVAFAAPEVIDEYCTVQSATLDNATVSYGAKRVASGLAAEYSQTFCQSAGVYWLGPGGLIVHAK